MRPGKKERRGSMALPLKSASRAKRMAFSKAFFSKTKKLPWAELRRLPGRKEERD
jgi:hypothetical protein